MIAVGGIHQTAAVKRGFARPDEAKMNVPNWKKTTKLKPEIADM